MGVFPIQPSNIIDADRLPHARGGVSPARELLDVLTTSSPRPWGCFYAMAMVKYAISVFPTPVGVFPLGSFKALSATGLPHARGGVS